MIQKKLYLRRYHLSMILYNILPIQFSHFRGSDLDHGPLAIIRPNNITDYIYTRF